MKQDPNPVMHLSRLCFVLPADTDEIGLVPLSPPPKKQLQTTTPVSRFNRRGRRRRRRFTGALCGCFGKDDHHQVHQDSSLLFHDIPGIALSSYITSSDGKKKVTSATNPRIFSYSELYIGSNGFSDKEILGSGGFGRVYRAQLPSDGTLVAVKCVAANRGGSKGLDKTFMAELAAVAQLRHRNLVPLRGWCVHERELLLVYDYMPNLSLDRLLFPPPSAPPAAPLGWDRRKRIASGLAAALFYLHEQLDTQIIHRDVKTSNVMLDSGYNARLGDFGLARWLEHGDKLGLSTRSASTNNQQFRLSATSRIGGTIGYLPPESFQKKGMGTAKSDVFSFGVVVLEIATGRRAVDLTYPDDQIFLLDWVRRLYDEGKTLEASDQRLTDGSYPLLEMRKLIHLGLLCTLHDPQSRPTMKWVVEIFAGGCHGELPALPSFHSQPQYIYLSSSTNTSTTVTRTTYATAADTTMFLTADTGGDATRSNFREKFGSRSLIPNLDTPREIPYEEIVAITGDFSESHKVAELDFGTGYHGYFEDGRRVLVKRLGMRTCPALRARFTDELHNLGRLRHRHLVQLRGWCNDFGEMLVVYDYTASGLLGHHLFLDTKNVLMWYQRYNIVQCLASAILYLHEEWDEQVIHRNITSSAIFLDSDMNPRLGCFALAEFLSRNEHEHHVANLSTSPARGIFGYMAPEYMESGEATTMADVYSFGVVVLEVVTGMMAVDFRQPEVLLVRKVRHFEEQNRAAVDLADRRLDGRFDRVQLMRLATLGMACTRSDAGMRPTMKQIVCILDGNERAWKMLSQKIEGREEWEQKNASALHSIRRIQALGIS